MKTKEDKVCICVFACAGKWKNPEGNHWKTMQTCQ